MKLDQIRSLIPDDLRSAIDASPTNSALLIYAANKCSELGSTADGEQILRYALAASPNDSEVQLAFASNFFEQDKDSEALVVIEEVLAQTNYPVQTNILHARLLLRRGEFDAAKSAYHDAIEANPDLAEDDLTESLGDLWKDDVPTSITLEVSSTDTPELNICQPDIDYSNVGGMDSLKEEIRMKAVYPLQKPDLFAAYGKRAGGGVLLYGPPGCGKTFLARATAGEVDAPFISVGIGDVLNRYLGESERNLRRIFDQARRLKPCVLFFDEVDALGASRTDLKENWFRSVINQFLVELDGVDSSNEEVVVLAATNAPWFIDPAFRRPGRFDRVLFVPPPDNEARIAVLRLQLSDKPTEEINYEELASQTEGFSCADLQGVVNEVVEQKLHEAIKAGHPTPITQSNLLSRIKSFRPSCAEWFASAKNYVLFANEGGQYDDLARYLQ